MSYPSLVRCLREEGVSFDGDAGGVRLESPVLDVASGEDVEPLLRAYVKTFKEDLPKGFSHVTSLVSTLCGGEEDRSIITLDPSSEDGKQFVRLLGFDVPRVILESHFNCAFGLYNCCTGVAAFNRAGLRLSLREQASFQGSEFLDC